MKLTDADSMFATVMRTIINAVAGDPLDQATIDKCDAISLQRFPFIWDHSGDPI